MNNRPKSPPERQNWRAMIKRCTNPKHPFYERYGGRGITVCKRWLTSFAAFLEDMGPKPTPKHTIERDNNEGNYEPGNVRWATQTEQLRNRGSYNNVIVAFGHAKTLGEWCELYDQWPSTVRHRLAHGWTPDDAVSTPATPRAQRGAIGVQKRGAA